MIVAALVISYLALFAGLWRVLWVPIRPQKVSSTALLPGLRESDLTSDTDYRGFV